MGRRSPSKRISFFFVMPFQAMLFAALFLCAQFLLPNTALALTKSLKLYYVHTGEKATITFKKNGKYLPSGLKKINWFLRDWRHNEPTKMSPKLLDLIWEVYRRSGSKAYITVISGYRSPATNSLLRKRGRGVAKRSQHMLGKALDFFLPDVKLKKIREIGLKMQVGGVGYYPTSGSPFVHLDVGNVRHWPRMSRRELLALFPTGKTMHIPTDGKPLAHYEQAVADYKRRSATGKLVPQAKTTKKELGFFQRLAQNTKADKADDSSNEAAPAPRAVSSKVIKPQPKPAPEVVVETAETQLAALPKAIPVPIVAPRADLSRKGQEIALADLPTDQQTTVDPLLEEPQPEGADVKLADLNIPVPARNPALERPNGQNTVIAAIDESLSEPKQNSENVLALNDSENQPVRENRIDAMQVAALTPQEIEDLRAAARPTIPVKPLTAPTPSVPVGSENTSIKPKPVESETASVTPMPEINNTASTAPEPEVPSASNQTQNPVTLANVETRTLEPIGLEPGTKSKAKIAFPTKNPIVSEQNRIAQLEAEKAKEKTGQLTDLASLPIPVQNPISSEIAKAENEPETQMLIASLENTPAEIAVNEPLKLPRRTISLDAYSAPQNNSASIGQWALSNETTIRELAEVQAPAYGRNIIRQIPGTILVQGFNLMPFGPGKNNFKGKAVTAMHFARLELK